MSRCRHSAGPRWALALASVAAAWALAACPSGPSRHDGGGADDAAGAGGKLQAPRAPEVSAASPSPAGNTTDKSIATTAKPPAPPAPEDIAAPVDLVTLHVLVEPPQRAHVIWGAKDFGLGPLDIRRPRGSGPLDLLVRAPGYLTLHTRAFTDRDSTLSVHLVPEAEATRFPGYQAPAATVSARGTTAAAAQKTTVRAPRSGKPSDGPRAP